MQTTAVGSLLVGQVVSHVQHAAPGEYTNAQIAHTLSLLAGCVMLFFGLLRLGWVVEFIPYIPISAFVTAASITIMATQVPACVGIPDINTRESPYKVIISTLKGLPNAHLDAAIGLTSIALLFAIRDACAYMERRQPARKRVWSFVSSLRLTFVMVLFTLVSFAVHNDGDLSHPKFRVVGQIDAGFREAGLPKADAKLARLILPELPAIAIILVIEHIAIAKAMGRMYGYTVRPSQEVVALGAANLLSPFVGGYVCTGSFGASAVLSKAGVRTPLAGLFSAMVLVLALYVLTAVFKFIPNAALAGLIIHAVCNLLTPPKNLYKYWQLAPLELFIWFIGVILAVFDSLETSIYAGIGLSFALLLVRLARTKGQFLGRVRTWEVVAGDKSHGADGCDDFSTADRKSKGQGQSRHLYIPLDRCDASNPQVKIDHPYPGVFVYRFGEGYNYTNQALHIATLMDHVEANTRRTSEEHFERESDRLWNDPGPKKKDKMADDDDNLPVLRAIVLDCAAVNNMDVTSIQGLVDMRNALDRYCAPDAVELHFANVHNRWTRRALAASGFGFPSSKNQEALACWQPCYTIAAVLDPELVASETKRPRADYDVEAPSPPRTGHATDADTLTDNAVDEARSERKGKAAVYGVDRPFFHPDLHTAVDAAVRDAECKDASSGIRSSS